MPEPRDTITRAELIERWQKRYKFASVETMRRMEKQGKLTGIVPNTNHVCYSFAEVQSLEAKWEGADLQSLDSLGDEWLSKVALIPLALRPVALSKQLAKLNPALAEVNADLEILRNQ